MYPDCAAVRRGQKELNLIGVMGAARARALMRWEGHEVGGS